MNYICTTKHTFISYLSCCFGQGPNKKQHEERKSYPASQLGGILSLALKASEPKQEAGSSLCTFSQEAWNGKGGEIQSSKPQGSLSVSHCQQQGSPLKVSSAFQSKVINLGPSVQTLEPIKRQFVTSILVPPCYQLQV